MSRTPQELKRALIDAGFEIYRTVGDEVVLADRVRDNLIMDSGIRIRASEPLQIRAVMGVRRSQYAAEEDAGLYDRVRILAEPLLGAGFAEVLTRLTPVSDPTDPTKTLDTFYEILYSKEEPSLEAATPTVALALRIAKTAESRH